MNKDELKAHTLSQSFLHCRLVGFAVAAACVRLKSAIFPSAPHLVLKS